MKELLLFGIFKIIQIYTGKWLQGMSLHCLSVLSVLKFLSSSDSKGFCILKSISVKQWKQDFFQSLQIYFSLIK